MIDPERLPLNIRCHHFDGFHREVYHKIGKLTQVDGRLRLVSEWIEQDGTLAGISLTQSGDTFAGAIQYRGSSLTVLATMNKTRPHHVHHWEVGIAVKPPGVPSWVGPIWVAALKPRRRR